MFTHCLRMQRGQLLQRVQQFLRNFPCVALLRPRQSGKTTIARQIATAEPGFDSARNYFDLDQLTLVCPGDTAHELEPRVRVRGLNQLIQSGIVA